MDYAKIQEQLKGLISDNTTPEQAEKIAAISKDIETAKTEYENQLIKNDELRGKYIKALQNSTFRDEGKPEPQDDHPKTLEECVEEVVAKRKQ